MSSYTINQRSYQSLDHRLQEENPLSLVFNHLIWYEVNAMMIVFSMLIISNVFQKPILIIIIISMHNDQMKNLNFI